MSNRSTTGSSRETSIRNQSNGRAKSHTGNCGSWIEHLSHTRTTLWSLIADNNNIACNNFTALDSSNCIFLAVKDTRRTFMNHHFRYYGRTFYNAGIRCQVTFQNGDATSFTVWIINWTNHFRITVYYMFNVLTYRLSGHSHKVRIKKSLLIQFIHYRINTACLIQLFHIGVPCRCQMTKVRCLCTNFIGNIKIQFYACFMSNCRQMKHRIGRTSKCHINCHRI